MRVWGSHFLSSLRQYESMSETKDLEIWTVWRYEDIWYVEVDFCVAAWWQQVHGIVEITRDSKIELYEIKTTNDYKLFEIWGELTKRLFYNRTLQHSIWFGYILQQSNKNVNYIQIECQLYSILYYTTSHHIITLHHSV